MDQIRAFEAQKELQVPCSTTHQKILKYLQTRVQGQAYATAQVANALASQQEGNNENYKFLFIGPSGTGKTELAKGIGHYRKLIRFDMNLYAFKESYTTIFGAPMGCIGSDDRPDFAKRLDPEGAIESVGQ